MVVCTLFGLPGIVLADLSDKVQVIASLDFLSQSFLPGDDFFFGLDAQIEILMLHHFFHFDPLHVISVTLNGRVHRLDHRVASAAVFC